MNLTHHSMSELFEQLGLDNSQPAIQQFLHAHPITDRSLPLAEAPFWNVQQSAFIREAWHADSDWSYTVDQLDNLLRK